MSGINLTIGNEIQRYLDSANVYKRSINIGENTLEYLDLSLLDDMRTTAEHYKYLEERVLNV